MAFITVNVPAGDIKVKSRWVGDNLAVHATVCQRDDKLIGLATNKDNVFWHWTITHKHTGLVAAKFRKDNFKVALLIAKMYDCLFDKQTKDAIHQDKELVEEWKKTVRKYNGKIG